MYKEQYNEYLIDIGQADSTIEQHLKNLDYYLDWCDEMGIEEHEFVSRGTILEYTKHMQSIPVGVGTQNIRINGLRHYYQCLLFNRIIAKNPVGTFTVRGAKKTVVKDALSEEELLELYQQYVYFRDSQPRKNISEEMKIITDLRYKVVMSFIIFQGMHGGDMDRLLRSDINLENGVITIVAGRRTNERNLPLHQSQIILLYRYLELLPSSQEKLFVGTAHNIVTKVINELKGLNSRIGNLSQIRSSVIIQWTSMFGKRKAQYMTGHKWVSSTEIYQKQDTKELTALIEAHHLFA